MSRESLELIKEIAHTIMHRMSLLQKIFMCRTYSSFRKTYDQACEDLANLSEEENREI